MLRESLGGGHRSLSFMTVGDLRQGLYAALRTKRHAAAVSLRNAEPPSRNANALPYSLHRRLPKLAVVRVYTCKDLTVNNG